MNCDNPKCVKPGALGPFPTWSYSHLLDQPHTISVVDHSHFHTLAESVTYLSLWTSRSPIFEEEIILVNQTTLNIHPVSMCADWINPVINLEEFLLHFRECKEDNIWSTVMSSMGLYLTRWNYKHRYRNSPGGGLEVQIKFRPSPLETLNIHFKHDYIEFSHFFRTHHKIEYDQPQEYVKQLLPKPWHELWPEHTLKTLLKNKMYKPCYKPIVFHPI